MKRWQIRILLASAALITALPAASQRSPESLLPPGFDQPPAAPQPQQPQPSQQPQQPLPGGSPGGPSGTIPAPVLPGLEGIAIENLTDDELRALMETMMARQAEERLKGDIPDSARRSAASVGPLGPENGGMPPDAFGRSHGVFLATLLDRLDAPLPSRWASIVLRRALLTHAPAPYGVDPVDWIAGRAALLLRMGEADGARLLVQSVDVDRFTPKMAKVAVETALATADPAGLCPLTVLDEAKPNLATWPLVEAMCAALEGEASRASALIDDQRKRGPAGDIDLLLAEKVVGAGTDTRRAVTIEWDPVDMIDSWRFGLASATGLVIPERLLDNAGQQMRAWQARAPMLPLEDRLDAADVAASLGVFSSRSLVELYSLIGDMTDPAEMKDSIADRLREAYVGNTVDARIGAMRNLWVVETPARRHARLILTAAAAARIPASSSYEGDAPALLASMLTAGFDRQAARWASIVGDMGGGDRVWALLALASPRPVVEVSAGRVSDFQDNDDSEDLMRTRLLIAALAGLGRISEEDAVDLAADAGFRLDGANRWTMMIDSAARNRQPATVAILMGVGMQTGDWRGVPPVYFFHIIRALRLVGLDYEARMIAAEAVSRL